MWLGQQETAVTAELQQLTASQFMGKEVYYEHQRTYWSWKRVQSPSFLVQAWERGYSNNDSNRRSTRKPTGMRGPDVSPGGVSSLTETGEQQQQQLAYHCQVGLCSAEWKLGTCKINAYKFLLLQSTIFIYIAEMAQQNWLWMNLPGLWIHNQGLWIHISAVYCLQVHDVLYDIKLLLICCNTHQLKNYLCNKLSGSRMASHEASLHIIHVY